VETMKGKKEGPGILRRQPDLSVLQGFLGIYSHPCLT
jgi:hypothetical protein